MTKHLFFLIPLIALLSCGDSPEKFDTKIPAEGKPVVYAVNYPLAYFAETLAGPNSPVTVVFPKIEGDPAFWEPTDADIAAMQQATIILRNGATYAKWADIVSLPESTQRNTSKAFTGDYIAVTDETAHTHGTGEAHAHAGTVFTTWIDLQQAIWQAEEVQGVLIELVPEDQKGITERFNALAAELDVLHANLLEIGKRLDNKPLVASHPIYQYAARRYKLNLQVVHWEPNVIPDADGMAELLEKLVDHSAKAMIWEDAPAPESIEKLNELGIRSVVFNPAGNRPDKGDFMSVMRANVSNLESLAQ